MKNYAQDVDLNYFFPLQTSKCAKNSNQVGNYYRKIEIHNIFALILELNMELAFSFGGSETAADADFIRAWTPVLYCYLF